MSEFNLMDLQKPFTPDQLEWRVQRAGVKNNRPWAQVLVYVTARAVFDRLDAVVGPENWHTTEPKPVYGTKTLYAGKKHDYKKKEDYPAYSYNQADLQSAQAYDTQTGCLLGFNLGIAIRIHGEWVQRWDGADVTDVEPYKGGISSAVKRAAVPWGIGRYLYSFGDSWADFDHVAAKHSKLNSYISGSNYSWVPPLIPEEFLPDGWEGDQYAHLMKNGRSTPKQSVVKQEPVPLAKEPDGEAMKKATMGVADLRNKALMASTPEDKTEIQARVVKAREYFGTLFSEAKIDDSELKQLQMLLKSVEEELDA